MIALPSVMLEVRFTPRKQKSGNYSLQVSLKSEQHGFTRERGLGIKVNPKEWDKNLMRFKEAHRNKTYRQITRKKNQQLNTLEETIIRVYDSKIIHHEPIDLVGILDFVLQRDVINAVKPIPELLTDFINSSQKIHNLRDSTISNWRHRRQKFFLFLKKKKIRTVAQLNKTSVIQQFIEELCTQDNLKAEAVNYHLEFVIRFLDYLKKHNLIRNNEAKEIQRLRPSKGEMTPYLTSNQVLTLQKIDLSKRDDLIRKQFLFLCYTGMSYVDFQRSSADWIFSKNGNKYLKFKRQKTGTRCIVPCPPELEPFIKIVFSAHHRYKIRHFNNVIKKIGQKAEIPFPLTSKIGRTTYANFLLKEKKATLRSD